MPRNSDQLSEFDELRREFLVRALTSGALVGGLGWMNAASASWFGRRPKKLKEGRSIFELKGDVRVNGEKATRKTVLTAGDEVVTGSNSYLIAAVGDTSFIQRENSRMVMSGTKLLVRAMRLVEGALLSAFGRRDRASGISMATRTATIGIRGTGVYMEAHSDATYLCTCYGTADITSAIAPDQTESVTTTHHESPRWILGGADNGRFITPAPFLNHTDEELMTIEAIVGREVPFLEASDPYKGPRREY